MATEKRPKRGFRSILLPLTAALLWFGYPPSPAGADPFPLSPSPQIDPIADLLLSIPPPSSVSAPLEDMGYSIQVGAFSNLENAVRLERVLQERGIDAYYFRHESGLYKVRFGNHSRYRAAREEAERLQAQGLIDKFFIVVPEDYAASRIRTSGLGDLREELIQTAFRFLGVPYRWGGTDDANGFDCSGLTMVCYRLNGLNLPRVSRNQFKAGREISTNELRKGDLVFFATNGGREVSHVGMYIGDGKFIHAPRTGEKVRIEPMASPYWARAFLGARTYF